MPSDRATESDTTASTPPMPTVPNATTGSCFGLRPGDRDRAAQRQLVQGAHGVGHGDAAAGDALPELVGGRRGPGRRSRGTLDGSTPSTACSVPLIMTLAASIGSALVTPGCRATAARTGRTARTARRPAGRPGAARAAGRPSARGVGRADRVLAAGAGGHRAGRAVRARAEQRHHRRWRWRPRRGRRRGRAERLAAAAAPPVASTRAAPGAGPPAPRPAQDRARGTGHHEQCAGDGHPEPPRRAGRREHRIQDTGDDRQRPSHRTGSRVPEIQGPGPCRHPEVRASGWRPALGSAVRAGERLLSSSGVVTGARQVKSRQT